MAKKIQFGSRIGLIAATVGSAVGLGNVWRFPAETQANGGAAFLLVYTACVFLLGIPVMLAEFSLGRAGGSDAVGSLKNVGASKGWSLIGFIGVLASYLILCFYMVVAGWTLEYLLQSITGNLYNPVAGATGTHATFAAHMKDYISSTWNPLVNTYLMILLNLVVLLRGVQKGIERMSNVLMPLLFLLLLVFAGVSLSFPKAGQGLTFFFAPDFAKITPGVLLNALGQAFFSLSLGMGILITYAAYFPKNTPLGKTAVTVSLLDLLVAVLMGVVIFPAVMQFGLSGESLEGATLVFVTLPEVFAQLPACQLWSVMFFLLLLVAALTSTISIAEVSVRFLQDRFSMSRVKSCLLVLLPLFLFSTLCSLSNGPLSGWLLGGRTLFDALDNFATNWLLPIGALLLCVYMGWFAKPGLMRGQLTNHGNLRACGASLVIWLVKYPAPVLIAVVFLSNLLR